MTEKLRVTFWHENCLNSINQLIFFTMIELRKHYRNSKRKAIALMKKGQLNAYFDALIEMNHYKRLMHETAK